MKLIRKLVTTLVGGVLLLVLLAGVAVAWLIASENLPPRLMARMADHLQVAVPNNGLAAAGAAGSIGSHTENQELQKWLTRAQALLLYQDRGDLPTSVLPLLSAAQAAEPDAKQTGRLVAVASAPALIEAIRNAQPGDRITLAPGQYHFDGRAISVERPGTETARITVRAAQPGSVTLDFNMVEGFHVLVPYWTFENLTIRGVCAAHSNCEHAFHVVAQGHDFIARHNRISDFNAHFKINGDFGHIPDNGLIEANTLTNNSARHTSNPVTPVDLVAASGWHIVGNRISDFVRDGADRVSYGVFVKGAGSDNHIERNLVVCERELRGQPGARVGLSLGGGGSTPNFCRDGACKVEQDNSLIQSNLVAACSDVGIYINRASNSRVIHNTLIDTAGIDVRFPESKARVEGNLVDGVIPSRNGGVIEDVDNYPTSLARLYAGSHPVRALFKDASRLDFNWSGTPPRRAATQTMPPDLCGSARPAQPTYGAFEDYAYCK